MRAVGQILTCEYEAAKTEFDRAREAPTEAGRVKTACERCLASTIRLTKFLAEGEIPADVEKQLGNLDQA